MKIYKIYQTVLFLYNETATFSFFTAQSDRHGEERSHLCIGQSRTLIT